MTDYTEGFIHWDLIPGPGLAGQGNLTYKSKQYGITITGFEIGFQFTLASYIKFKGPPQELAGSSVNFSIGLGLGLGISVGAAGAAALAEVGSAGYSWSYNWSTITPIDPNISDKGYPGDPSNLVGRYNEWELIAETPLVNLQIILIHAYGLGLDAFDKAVTYLENLLAERLSLCFDLIQSLFQDLQTNGTPTVGKIADLQATIPGVLPPSAAAGAIFAPSIVQREAARRQSGMMPQNPVGCGGGGGYYDANGSFVLATICINGL